MVECVEEAEPEPSEAKSAVEVDELVLDAAVVAELNDEEEEEGEEEDAVALWIRANFLSVKSERDVAALRLLGGLDTALCDECAARQAAVSCVDCGQELCWRCADAIHIIPQLAAHSVRLAVAAIQDAAAPIDVNVVDTDSDRQAASPSTIPNTTSPLHEDHRSSPLTVGCDVLFRVADCGRWPRELLHGVLVSSSTSSATATNGDTLRFVRVLWLRGVQTLANGSFRASLLLRTPSSGTPSIPPTALIGVFPSRLAALRAVAVAEALARRSRRHARAAAVLNRHSSPPALTRSEVAHVLSNALEELDGLALALPLCLEDDQQFLEDIVAGRWDLDAWLQAKLGDDLTREWQDEGMEHFDGLDSTSWPPPKQQLVRFWSPETRELSLPALERSRQLHRVVQRLLFVSTGFAWSRWLKFVHRHRRHERRKLESQSAAVIQRWCRHRWQRSSSTSSMAATWSMDELEQTFRRRQAAAESLFHLLVAQWEKRMKRVVERWATAAELQTPDVQRRIGRVQHSTKWHPSHGMNGGSNGGSGSVKGLSDDRKASTLPPRLPRVFARATADGRVAVEDAARFQQFRATHAGPTAASYWLLRGRVLLGAYPTTSSHSNKGKDPVTSVLLEQANAFVCLLATRELQTLEAQLERSEADNKADKLEARSQTPEMTTRWRFERLVRQRYNALTVELRAGEKRAERQLELALKAEADAAELVATRQASRRSSAQDVEDAERELDMAAARLELARQHSTAAHAALERLTMRLAFDHLPILKDGGPEGELASLESEVRSVLELVSRLEERLRAGQNLFVFSSDGRGRTGLVGALLLGRLYGLTAREALEHAQRTHDCQSRYQPGCSSSGVVPASPTSARHVALVRAALAASTDAIYAPLTRENPAEAFVSTREARRGLLAAPLLTSDGALLSEEPDEQKREQQLEELEGEQRVAKREAAGHRRTRDRRRETSERVAMSGEDCGVVGREVSDAVAAAVRVLVTEIDQVNEAH